MGDRGFFTSTLSKLKMMRSDREFSSALLGSEMLLFSAEALCECMRVSVISNTPLNAFDFDSRKRDVSRLAGISEQEKRNNNNNNKKTHAALAGCKICANVVPMHKLTE